ncbi:MAG: carboxypeptidase regulatory-like domain-containing protein [Candidatus Contendobacter sp.]
MSKTTLVRWTALGLILGGGWLSLANAQQTATQATQPQPAEHAIPLQTPAVEAPAAAPAATVPASKATPDKAWAPPGGSIKVKTSEQGIRYASGGVGESEREELRALAKEFNLELMFAMQGGGEYLADVGVRVLDVKGAVILTATSKGPYFLTQLPTGGYTVEVSAKEQTQTQKAQIGADQSRLNFYWR